MWHVLKTLLGVRSRPPRDHGADRDQRATWWTTARRPPRESDLELTDAARRWLALTPAHARPVLLAARHPRIVNRMAALRGDPAQLLEWLDALLVDERGGRAGFVPAIRAEIVRLGFLCRARMRESNASDVWTEAARSRSDRASEHDTSALLGPRLAGRRRQGLARRRDALLGDRG